MKSSIVNSIQSLPPLSKTIININTVYADEEASIHDMEKVVESDPMIIANLLKAANSPLYGFAKEINKPSQAVALFGMSMTRSIALSNAIRKLLNVDMQPYGVTSAEVTAKVFQHWSFEQKFINMILYSDSPKSVPKEIQEYAMALNIVKAIVPMNNPFSEIAINIGLKKAHDAGYNHELLEDAIDDILDELEK